VILDNVSMKAIDLIKPFLELFEKSAKPAGIAANGSAHVPLMANMPV
jgi:hypothetical protein